MVLFMGAGEQSWDQGHRGGSLGACPGLKAAGSSQPDERTCFLRGRAAQPCNEHPPGEEVGTNC